MLGKSGPSDLLPIAFILLLWLIFWREYTLLQRYSPKNQFLEKKCFQQKS